jgi:hypothetical protein
MSMSGTIVDAQMMDTTEPVPSILQPPSASDGELNTGTISHFPSGPNHDSSSAFATTPERNTGGRVATTGRSNQYTGRGRNFNSDRGSGGRIPMGGRGLVMGGRSGPNYNTYGRGYNNNHQHPHAQRAPIQIHASSGVPFGHVPAYLPGSSSLVEELDQRILLVLRDGKHIIGVSFLLFCCCCIVM